mmetsp:Transcript_23615/g.60094  ORF Transcript_23615/g.60094 Transcript_23615/m.60094 type:complete len:311 (+) Transcript_23615:53-985(+)
MTQTPACPLYNDTGQSLPVVPPLLPAPAGGVRLPEVRLVHRGEVAVQPGRARGVDVARILRFSARPPSRAEGRLHVVLLALARLGPKLKVALARPALVIHVVVHSGGRAHSVLRRRRAHLRGAHQAGPRGAKPIDEAVLIKAIREGDVALLELGPDLGDPHDDGVPHGEGVRTATTAAAAATSGASAAAARRGGTEAAARRRRTRWPEAAVPRAVVDRARPEGDAALGAELGRGRDLEAALYAAQPGARGSGRRPRRRLRRWRRWRRCRWRRAHGAAVRLLEVGDGHVVEVALQTGRRAPSPLFDGRSRT